MSQSPSVPSQQLRLLREVRFGLHEHPLPRVESANGFAANPALVGLAPHVSLTVGAVGEADPVTGMLINIKLIDSVVRESAVELIRAYFAIREDERPAGDLVLQVFDRLAASLSEKSEKGEGGKKVELDSIELALSPYLRLSTNRKERPMVQLTERFEFSAAHRLHAAELSEKENHEIFGRCNNANGHGHNYELEVTVFGEPDSHGRVISISELQKIVNSRVVDVFDHKHLNLDCPEFSKLNPTVENIAKIIYEKLATSFSSRAKLRRVRVWETPKTCCEYPA